MTVHSNFLQQTSVAITLYCVLMCSFLFHPFNRSELKKLIVHLNEEKKILKEEGVTVDGIHYKVKFIGTGIVNCSVDSL